jgi:hypothetical protein
VAGHFQVPLVDVSNRPDYKANPTLSPGDIKIIRHTGGEWDISNITSLPSPIPGASTLLDFALTATELNPDDTSFPIIIQCIDQSPKEWDDQTILIWTKPPSVTINHLFGDTMVTILVKDAFDVGIPDVKVQIMNSAMSLMLDSKVTDINGSATFMLYDGTGYKVLLYKPLVGFDIPENLSVSDGISPVVYYGDIYVPSIPANGNQILIVAPVDASGNIILGANIKATISEEEPLGAQVGVTRTVSAIFIDSPAHYELQLIKGSNVKITGDFRGFKMIENTITVSDDDVKNLADYIS